METAALRPPLMHDAEIFVKTDAGREAIRSRTLGLSMPVRAILLMVDGQKTVAAMRSIIAGSKAPHDTLHALVQQGLIEPRDGPLTVPPAAPLTVPPVVQLVEAPVAPVPTSHPEPVTWSPVPTVPLPSDENLDFVLPAIEGTDAAPVTVDAPNGVPVLGNRYERLYGMMNEIVRDFLPAHRRYFFQLKIERCTTADELMELLHDLRTVLGKARGDAFATEVVARLRSASV
jgi:hypothetical protein